MCLIVQTLAKLCKIIIVTGPEKTGLIYTKYTYLHYGNYLLFCRGHIKSVSSFGLVMEFCIIIMMKMLLQYWVKTKLSHFKVTKLGQILCVGKTAFLRPVHNYVIMYGLQTSSYAHYHIKL